MTSRWGLSRSPRLKAPIAGPIGSLILPIDLRTCWELYMITELRCDGTMHGKLNIVDGKLEVKCGRRTCGARRGIVVLHTFDINSGDMVGTQRYADPIKEGDPHGSR